MSNLKNKIEQAVKDAMRSGDHLTRSTLRLVLAAIKQSEVDQRKDVDDTAILGILQKELKNRNESMEDAKKAGRDDLIQEIENEIKVIKEFLPEEMSDEDLLELVRTTVSEASATSPSDMGKVMKILIPRVQGKAPGYRISQAVRSLLEGK